MTLYEILKSNESLVNILRKNNVSMADIENLAIYERFAEMKAKGHKTIYCIAVLGTEYGKSERTMYEIIKKFRTSVRF